MYLSSTLRGFLADPVEPSPVRERKAATHCATQIFCDPVPDRLKVTAVAGVPFEYVAGDGMIDCPRGSALCRIASSQQNRAQLFKPGVLAALTVFLIAMKNAGMSAGAILTGGSHVCRCVKGRATKTNTLSDHARAEAIDIHGIRWGSAGPSSTLGYTLLLNRQRDPADAVLLRRINACLRLGFPRVLDYHFNRAHEDHFHCDLNQGGQMSLGFATWGFVQEVLGLPVDSARAWKRRQHRRASYARIIERLRLRPGATPGFDRNVEGIRHALRALFLDVASGRT